MKVYRIVFYVFTVMTLYNFVYITFFQENTYFRYVREYHNAGNIYPTYSIGEDTSNEPDHYELCGIPNTGKYLRELYYRTYPFVLLLFIPLLIYGIVLFFVKKKYLDRKWWIPQLIGYACLFYMVVVISNNI
jgi:hypothetical protein